MLSAQRAAVAVGCAKPTWSSSGELVARRAASKARLGPLAEPMPMRAVPASRRICFAIEIRKKTGGRRKRRHSLPDRRKFGAFDW